MTESISTELAYPSRYVDVRGSRMHYVEAGEGAPILLLHGNPTSAYLWRNVIPHLEGVGRCIAPDLIGFGRSDKPDIGYSVFDHYAYLADFIAALELRDLRLVVHDWGGFLGLRYAAQHPDRVQAVAMMEAVAAPMRMADRTEGFQRAFGMMRGPGGREKVLQDNFFVERILPGSVQRTLSEAELAAYRAPFAEEASRLPTWVFPCEVPLDGEPANVDAAVREHTEALAHAGTPLLLLTFEPGAITQIAEERWLREHLPQLQVQHLGPGIHFVQEDQPAAIGRAIAEWLGGL